MKLKVEALIRDAGLDGVCFGQVASMVHSERTCANKQLLSIPGYSKHGDDKCLDKTCRDCIGIAKQLLEEGMGIDDASSAGMKYLKVSACEHYRFVYALDGEVQSMWATRRMVENDITASKPWIYFSDGKYIEKSLEEYGKLILYTVMKHPCISEHDLVSSMPLFCKRDCWDLIDGFRVNGVLQIRLSAKPLTTTLFSENENVDDTGLDALLSGVDTTSFNLEAWRQETSIGSGFTYNEQIQVCYYLKPNCLSQIPVVHELLKNHLESIRKKVT